MGVNSSSLQENRSPDAEAGGSATPLPSHSTDPQTLDPKARSPAAGRLAHLCTLLSRLILQTEQAQAGEQSWQAGALETVYKHLVEPDMLLSDPACPQGNKISIFIPLPA